MRPDASSGISHGEGIASRFGLSRRHLWRVGGAVWETSVGQAWNFMESAITANHRQVICAGFFQQKR
jgi:hypothetical protein